MTVTTANLTVAIVLALAVGNALGRAIAAAAWWCAVLAFRLRRADVRAMIPQVYRAMRGVGVSAPVALGTALHQARHQFYRANEGVAGLVRIR